MWAEMFADHFSKLAYGQASPEFPVFLSSKAQSPLNKALYHLQVMHGLLFSWLSHLQINKSINMPHLS